jgi:nicotianamine aminotransferase
LAKHLSRDLPYDLSSDDIFLTAGGTQAIEVVISVLAQPGTNILLPRPGYPNYEARAALNNLEVRRFDLIPERGWEIDIDSLKSIADKNTTAMIIINPNNPCGSVYTREHLTKVWLLRCIGRLNGLELFYLIFMAYKIMLYKHVLIPLFSLGC